MVESLAERIKNAYLRFLKSIVPETSEHDVRSRFIQHLFTEGSDIRKNVTSMKRNGLTSGYLIRKQMRSRKERKRTINYGLFQWS